VRGNFAFVLCRPQSAGNIGAAARVLKNLGFNDLRLVAPALKRRGDAAAMAVHAQDVLASATTWPDLKSAVANCTLTVGTTCRPGPYRAAAEELRSFAPELGALAAGGRVAIIFGSEDHGLTNEELKMCQRLISIPTTAEYRSLNLAQAVAIVAYELAMTVDAGTLPQESFERAPAGGVDAMLDRLGEALVAIGFLPEDNPDHIMFTLRAIFGRSGLDPRELDVLNGIARQMRWAAEGGHATISAKRAAGRKLR
jgi:tRNA/rRNA methyltransferase